MIVEQIYIYYALIFVSGKRQTDKSRVTSEKYPSYNSWSRTSVKNTSLFFFFCHLVSTLRSRFIVCEFKYTLRNSYSLIRRSSGVWRKTIIYIKSGLSFTRALRMSKSLFLLPRWSTEARFFLFVWNDRRSLLNVD